MPDQAATSAQRIRIGLTGLAFAFLLVLLGSVISRSSRNQEGAIANDQSVVANQPNEPLAELGVAPGSADKSEDVAPTNDAR